MRGQLLAGIALIASLAASLADVGQLWAANAARPALGLPAPRRRKPRYRSPRGGGC